jgi:excisionase family DNA binding protein
VRHSARVDAHDTSRTRTRQRRNRPPHPNALAYSVDEAAHVIGVSRRTLYELIAEGRLASTKIRGRRVIPRVGLERLLAKDAQ